MILIFSESTDLTTTLVINNLKRKFFRFNSDEDIIEISCTINNNKESFVLYINSGEVIINLDKVTKIWYRRGIGLRDEYAQKLDEIFKVYFQVNATCVNNYFFELVSGKTIGSYSKEMEVNKVLNLSIARESDILVPPTKITSSKKDLEGFLKIHKRLVIKPLKHPFSFEKGSKIVTPSSGILVFDNLIDFPDKFSLSLFQKYIEKKFEVRVFFIEHEYYAFAIFSQSNKGAELDFRDGNQKLLRTVPYNLSNDMIKKLKEMQKKMNLNTGSIDIVVDNKSNFYFLEVNPSGQFLSFSENNNCYLENRVRHYLEQK
ncbi:hypothetical protein U6A24_23135 [Aquimarina gracilis]|uniref:ATP-grasp domain-containing protein n=1 Tax=Aquimarina gracilis TaxID=874422 RepID=A0ABU6A2I4_9FLAO|nr:hypothetical protein [Aquimarina gracilis]MEB3348384.1 hypothetical protein [Aquimarina gracilis]